MVKVGTERLQETQREIKFPPRGHCSATGKEGALGLSASIPCWQELFEAQVARMPRAIAVVHGNSTLTYGELNRQADRLARHLRDLGVGPETLVGLSAVRSLEQIVGLLGIVKSGGAYVPLPPDYPPERMAHLIRDSQMPVIVTQQRLEGPLREIENGDTPVLVYLDGESAAIKEKPNGHLSAALSPKGGEGEHPGASGLLPANRDSNSPSPQRSPSRERETAGRGSLMPVRPKYEEGAARRPDGLFSPPNVGLAGGGEHGDGQKGEERGVSEENPGLISEPDSLIYVIYTSGSTGEPKGVAVENHAVTRHCLAFAEYFDLNPSDRVLQFAPLSFDVSVEEIFPTLITGGRVVLRPDAAPISIADFHSFITEQQATVLNLPTSYWNEWMKEIERRGLALPPSLRLVISGSERVTSRQLASWWKVAGKRVRWCNAYGTTEAVITSTLYEPDSEAVSESVPIGRPIPGTDVYLLNAHGHLVPDGEAGELCIGGEKLARGYLHQPAMTAWQFVPDPFSPGVGARLNRTGDYARRLPDGNLEFLGRRDDQVNVRGFRVELAEIEAALVALVEVSEAAVVVHGKGAEKRLVAYVVPAAVEGGQASLSMGGEILSKNSCNAASNSQADPGEFALTPALSLRERENRRPAVERIEVRLPGGEREKLGLASELRRLLKEKLPPYMIPATFIQLDALPRRANGKVDRQALPDAGMERPELRQTLVGPADELEEKLSAIWREVLSLDAVGVQDDFFDLGGHSLQAVRLISAVSAVSGRELSLRYLYEARTIRRLAERIRKEPAPGRNSSLMVIQPQGTRLPLYFVHGAGGGMIWGYANLSRHLGPDQPVYAFQSRALDGGEEFTRLEDMAAQYVADLRAFQPNGPYCIGGFCFGGEVAYEMARQLRAGGQQVDLLVLINAMPPNSQFEQVRLRPAVIAGFLTNSWAWLGYFFRWSSDAKRSFLRQKFHWVKKMCQRFAHRGNAGSISGNGGSQIDLTVFPENRRDLWDVHLRASAQYHPGPYEGKVMLFRTPIFPFLCSFDPTFGWNEFVKGELEVRVISGSHESVLDEPYVGSVAGELVEGRGAA